ncbi:MAG: hypothetical protein U0354_10140 [Candidatus Sericytochromatia bacterium]
MFSFFLLVILSLISGLFVTYKFKLNLYFSERIFYGFTISISVFTQIIYVITRFTTGLKNTPDIAALVLISLISLYSLYGLFKIKETIKIDFKNSIDKLNDKKNLFLPITMVFWSIIFIYLFITNLYINSEGIFSRTSTDMPVHMSFITSFVWGENFPHQTPLYAGEKLVYPFLSDYLTAFFISLGMNVIDAFNFQGILMCIVLTGVMYFFTYRITNSQKLSSLSTFILYLGGGWGFFKFFEKDLPSQGYNILNAFKNVFGLYTDIEVDNIQFYNFIIGYLLPQRSFLFGFPLALVTLSLVWIYRPKKKIETLETETLDITLNDDKPLDENQENNLTKNGLLLAGITAGVTPLFHYHSFMCVVIVICFWFILFFQKDKKYIINYLYFFIPMTILAIPQVLMATGRLSNGANQTFKIYIGWMAKDKNYLWFWFKNTGFMFLLVFDTLLSKNISKDIKKMYIPYLFLFIIANIISFSPCWIGDNAKVIFYWFIASIPLICLSLKKLFINNKIIAITIFTTIILSGTLDISKCLLTGQNIYKVWGVDSINIAKEIINKTDPKSIFLTAPIHYTPIYLTGRKILVGEGVHVCTQGINPESRITYINLIFETGDDVYKLDILRKLDADYALIGPPELSRMKDKTFFKRFFKEYIKVGEETVYKLKG